MPTKDLAAEIRREYEDRYTVPTHEPIEAGRVRDYLLAMDEPADLSADKPVPALFLVTLGRTRRPQPLRGSAVNAGHEYEFLAPVFIGDTVTVSRKVLSVEEKQGKFGPMFLTTAEISFDNQKGQLVGRSIHKVLRWGL